MCGVGDGRMYVVGDGRWEVEVVDGGGFLRGGGMGVEVEG